ncbi:pyocin activator PrtN family protein [Chromobacterium violaceum]|uniref:pyocin activator PrtN family protein n=1 Tax=Chromobacterium violaceum TaxID=536 RepID=UPI001B3316BF|nr:pyocin activator PrtN family protein [Chromobacterium violaceum]MBP4048983.1 pyocin activator PrtN family protein [Chromobacterium violaceum]
MSSRTAWLLMAQYETPSIPLAKVCEEHFGLSEAEANRAACLNKLPVPTYRVGESKRAPRHIHINDLAALIDQRHAEAQRSWRTSQV